MVNVNDAQIVRLKSFGHSFEILVDANLALAVKQGKSVSMNDLLAVSTIFSDAKKGQPAKESTLKEAFKTTDTDEIVKMIIAKGDIPLTTEYKHKLKEEKRKQIISIIHRNAVDPQTHLPHPPQGIENALNEAKFHVDESMDVNIQVQEALKAIRPIIPIKFEMKELSVKIPAEFAPKSYPILHQFGKKLREDWQSDGSLLVVVEIPGGLEEEFHNKLNALCHGNIETKVLNTR